MTARSFGRYTTMVALVCFAMQLMMSTSASAEVEREQLDTNPSPTGRLQINPGRVEADVQQGERSVFTLQLTNDSEKAYDITISTTDIGASSNPSSIASKVEDGEFGAGDWLTPEIRDMTLAPFERISFDIVVDTPVEAPVGTNLAGIIVDGAVASGVPGTGDGDGAFHIEGLVQVFLTVPGAVQHDVRITGIDVRDKYVFGSQRFAVWELTVENRGTVNEHVEGAVDIRSLFGNSAVKIPVKDTIVLRGAKRTIRIVWNDLPWIGKFTPEARLRADDAKLIKASGESVTILPWWLPVLVALTLIAPILWIWWRRRQEWKLYLEDEDLGDSGEWDERSSTAG